MQINLEFNSLSSLTELINDIAEDANYKQKFLDYLKRAYKQGEKEKSDKMIFFRALDKYFVVFSKNKEEVLENGFTQR